MIDLEQFEDTITSPEFNDRIQRLARYTLVHTVEGGFAVYRTPPAGDVTISEPELPPVNASLKTTYSIGTRYRFNPRPLIRDASGVVRQDIAMLVHSHPNGKKRLKPSITDMQMHEGLSEYNPAMIGGILTAATDEAQLLLYRRTRPDPYAYFQQLDNMMPLDRDMMLEVLRREGYRTATATYNLPAGQLETPVNEVVSELFGSMT